MNDPDPAIADPSSWATSDIDRARAEYCREIEAYLCRKNDGHLIRIVGPAFEQVCAWAARGVPLKLAFRGIDRYFERYYAKGPRRRPVRIEFCEPDVLDAFDEWRRALGVSSFVTTGSGGASIAAENGSPELDRRRRIGLHTHLERVIARLTALRAARSLTGAETVLDRVITELDCMRGTAKRARGEGRLRLLEHIAALDRELLDASRDACAPETLVQLRAEAEAELLPFRDRMTPSAFERAAETAIDRLLRERYGLPQLGLD